MVLYDYTQSHFLLLYLFITSIIFFLCILIFWKTSDKGKAIFLTIYISLFYLLILYPFNRGAEVEQLQELGCQIRYSISIFKLETGDIPEKLNELFPKYIEEDKKEIILEKFVYKKNDYKGKVFYSLYMYPTAFFPHYFYYSNKKNKFVLLVD